MVGRQPQSLSYNAVVFVGLCQNSLSPTVKGSDDHQFVLQWVMRVKQQVLIGVCRFSVHFNVEASVFFSVHCTVQEGQTVSSDIFPHELDVIVHSIHTQLFRAGWRVWAGARISTCSHFRPAVIPSHLPPGGELRDTFKLWGLKSGFSLTHFYQPDCSSDTWSWSPFPMWC